MLYFKIEDKEQHQSMVVGHVLPFYAVIDYIKSKYIGFYKPILCKANDKNVRFHVELVEDNGRKVKEGQLYYFKIKECTNDEFATLRLNASNAIISAKVNAKLISSENGINLKSVTQTKEEQLDLANVSDEFKEPKKRGGARKGAGRKPTKRGRSVVMRIPEQFKPQVLELIAKLSAELD